VVAARRTTGNEPGAAERDAQEAGVAAEWHPWADRIDLALETLEALGTRQQMRQVVAHMTAEDEVRLSHALLRLNLRGRALHGAALGYPIRSVQDQVIVLLNDLDRGVAALGNPCRMSRVPARWNRASRVAAHVRVQTALLTLCAWNDVLTGWHGSVGNEPRGVDASIVAGKSGQGPPNTAEDSSTDWRDWHERVHNLSRALDAFGTPQDMRRMESSLHRYNWIRLLHGLLAISAQANILWRAAYNLPSRAVVDKLISLDYGVLQLGNLSDPACVQVTRDTETRDALHAGIRSAIATLQHWSNAI
jgi:hypothetical protein